ncbi:LysE family translocator [Parvularcula dongshanensis]|uniref:Threonine/homoserine/homoserine lactone efflux protein n=1 Tax=Parvularcula dongshanensis TaxID=1173995 RepID=A0A840I4V0_9PROT|nr:LysE family translocator [Parvularcula dongshanensis]MBB4659303.1 threonine/homoserine/homoserine lactone efflux protein [Parvularcula dongshanensis]
MTNLLAMGAFALTMSISPGPVNMITLAAGLHHGPRSAFPFVLGSTIGFTSLLLAVGLAANLLFGFGDGWQRVMGAAGALVIVYFGIKIATAPSGLDEAKPSLPRFWQGAVLQWINPKAWAACLAAVSLFQLAGDLPRLGVFTVLYFVLCLIGVGSWALAGRSMRRVLSRPAAMRVFNLAVGSTLIVLAGGLSLEMLR